MSYLAAITKGVAVTSEVRTTAPRYAFGSVSFGLQLFSLSLSFLLSLTFSFAVCIQDQYGI